MGKKDFFYDSELAEMLHINLETIQLLCARGNFEHAEQLGDGRWIIPVHEFHMSDKQAAAIEEEMKRFDERTRQILSSELNNKLSDE
ncbi:hypothetical protein CN918_31635 [Priestia megaterium]|nr:hypothetical protein CN918_31635 [Priestia megaterium]